MTIETAIRQMNEYRERNFHDALVKAGVRPQGSRVEDYRQNRAPVEAVPVKAAGRLSEAAE